jgi:predicted regulator of Ras-like GTPase activity (Roadblock/LC7/MglB family)
MGGAESKEDAYTFRAAAARIERARQELNNEGGIAPRTRRKSLPVAVDALRTLLKDFNAKTGAKMSAIVSRSGVPVAWVLPDEAQVDNFATMAATLLGALEVIYATMKASLPGHVTVESEGGVLSIREVTGKLFFVAAAPKRASALARAIDDLTAKAKGLLV